jgi:hypothetical protein
MSNRIKGFYVALDEDIREDDFQVIKQAVLALRHVQAVEVSIANADDWMNRVRVQYEIREKLWNVLTEKP